MEDRAASAASPPLRRFDLAPPRRFLFPAVLLLLADEPSYGYRLVKELKGFGFGAADRPSVYRTLAQLERDGLVVSWSDAQSPAQSRRLYRLTPEGDQALRVWMGVIKQERDRLDAVLRRYTASRGIRRRAGRRGRRLGHGHRRYRSRRSARRATQPAVRRACRRAWPSQRPAAEGPGAVPRPVRDRLGTLRRARRRALERRSVDVRGDGPGRLDRDTCPRWPGRRRPEHHCDGRRAGRRTVARATRSTTPSCGGASMRDGFPQITLALRDCRPGGTPDHVRVTSDVTIHGVTRRLEGTLEDLPARGRGRRGDRGAGRRHPRLRHRVADTADAADLSRRRRQAVRRGRGGRPGA